MLRYLAALAVKQALRYAVQSSLAVLGVAIGVANIVMLISITDLGRRQTSGMLDEMGANLLFVAPFIGMEGGPLSGSFSPASASMHLPHDALPLVAQAQGIVAAAAVLLMPGHVGYGEKRWFTTLEGIMPEFPGFLGLKTSHGAWFGGDALAQQSRVCVLGQTAKQELFGTGEAVGQEVVIKGQRFRVAGVMAEKGRVGMEDVDNRVFMPVTTLQALFGFDGYTGIIAQYDPRRGGKRAIKAVKAQLNKLLNPGERLDETFTVITVQEATKLMDKALAIFRAVLAGVSSIALVVAGLGIMNVMLIRVMQRRFEIGIRRAVGATRAMIAGQFLLESMMLALAGAVLGLGLGLCGVAGYCRYAQWSFYVSPWTLVEGAAFSIGAGLIFGVAPALRATGVDPIATLRTEV